MVSWRESLDLGVESKMKNSRAVALGAVLLCLVFIVIQILMVKHVPRLEDSWTQTREAITPGKSLLLRSSYLFKKSVLILLPGTLALTAAAVSWYMATVRNQNANKAH